MELVTTEGLGGHRDLPGREVATKFAGFSFYKPNIFMECYVKHPRVSTRGICKIIMHQSVIYLATKLVTMTNRIPMNAVKIQVYGILSPRIRFH